MNAELPVLPSLDLLIARQTPPPVSRVSKAQSIVYNNSFLFYVIMTWIVFWVIPDSLQNYFSVEFSFIPQIIFFFLITRIVSQGKKNYFEQRNLEIQKPLLYRNTYDWYFNFIEESGFTQASLDAKSLIHMSTIISQKNKAFFNILNDSLQIYLPLLARISLSARKVYPHYEESTPFMGSLSATLKDMFHYLFQAPENQKSQAPTLYQSSELLKKDIFKGKVTNNLLLADKNIASTHYLLEKNPNLKKAALNACQELSHLKYQCESLLSQHYTENLEDATQSLRVRLEREKRVLEELNGLPL